MSDLFKLPDHLPNIGKKMPMFLATRFKSAGNRDEKYQAAFELRIREAQQSFNLDGKPASEGSNMVIRSGTESLEVYGPSDSLWWANHKLALQEILATGTSLPDEDTARELANAQLKKHKLDFSLAAINNVSYVEAAMRERDNKPQGQRTAVDVNYRFTLGGYPVMGPGAKIKVTFAGDAALAQLLYFWRHPSKAPEAEVISASTALDRFMRDPAFYQLRSKDAVVEIQGVTFGYYAMSPTDMQRMYVPVWAINATCRTREFEHSFRRHVVAIDVSPEDAKINNMASNPKACRVF